MESSPTTPKRESAADALLLELAARVQACKINSAPKSQHPPLDVPLIDCCALAPEYEKPSPLYAASMPCVWTQGRFGGDKVLVVGMTRDGDVQVSRFSLDTAEWTKPFSVGNLTAEPEAGACSSDSDLLLLCLRNSLHFYRVSASSANERVLVDASVGDGVRSCAVHPTGQLSAVVSDDGRRVIVYSMTPSPRSVGVINTKDDQCATCVEFTADGESLLVVSGANIVSEFAVSCAEFKLDHKRSAHMIPGDKEFLREFVTNKTAFHISPIESATLCVVDSNGARALATRHHLSVHAANKTRIFCPDTAGVVALSLQPFYYAAIDVTGMLLLWDYDGNLRQRAAPERTHHQFAAERELHCKCVVCKEAKRQTPNTLCKPVVHVRSDQRFLVVVDQWTVARAMSASVL